MSDVQDRLEKNSGEKRLYEEKLDAELRELQARLDLLRARLAKASVNARMSLQRELDRLTDNQSAIGKRLKELRAASEAGWARLREALEDARRELADGLEKLAQKLR
jgi:hypothetical protein